MKCSDISTGAILGFLALHQGRWSTWNYSGPHMPNVSSAMPAGTPPKLQLAKLKKLVKKGLIGGCTCGCRGDWEITDKGLAHIGVTRSKPYTGY